MFGVRPPSPARPARPGRPRRRWPSSSSPSSTGRRRRPRTSGTPTSSSPARASPGWAPPSRATTAGAGASSRASTATRTASGCCPPGTRPTSPCAGPGDEAVLRAAALPAGRASEEPGDASRSVLGAAAQAVRRDGVHPGARPDRRAAGDARQREDPPHPPGPRPATRRWQPARHRRAAVPLHRRHRGPRPAIRRSTRAPSSPSRIPRLVEPAVYQGEPLTFRVPPNRPLSSSLNIAAEGLLAARPGVRARAAPGWTTTGPRSTSTTTADVAERRARRGSTARGTTWTSPATAGSRRCVPGAGDGGCRAGAAPTRW